MAIKLTIRDLRNTDEQYTRTFVQSKVTIGRARHCDICLPDLSVSTCHTEIRLQGVDYCVVDNDSLNGTYVDEKKIIAHRPKKLSNDTILTIGHYEVVFNLGVSHGPPAQKNQAQSDALKMLQSVLANEQSSSGPALIVVSGKRKASRYELGPPPSVAIIGRSRLHDINLEDGDVSRRHAEVQYDGETITVTDVGSRNGMLHNGEVKTTFDLKEGDTFTVGNTTLALEHPLDPQLLEIQVAPEEETASFCASDLFKKDETHTQTTSNVADMDPKHEPEKEALPTGDWDPLAPKDSTQFAKTQEIPTLPGNEKSDVGLIVVGAIIVLLCVVCLIWLLT